MEVIHTTEDGLTRPNVCGNMKLSPPTLSKTTRNADEIERSMQHVTTVIATKVPQSLSAILQTRMEKLLSLWVDDKENIR